MSVILPSGLSICHAVAVWVGVCVRISVAAGHGSGLRGAGFIKGGMLVAYIERTIGNADPSADLRHVRYILFPVSCKYMYM